MAIDYIIELDCQPKRALTAAGILDRLKERERAETIIRWFRDAGDDRPPSEMGFEYTRSAPGDPESRQLIVVQDLLDHAADLDDQAHHCVGCPASRDGSPFGCMGFVPYPISARLETWLLERLPVPDEPLTWLLLKQGIQRLGYDGASVKALRDLDGEGDARKLFELPVAPMRRLGELRVTGDQALEMIVGVGERIIPNHAGILLLFFGAIDRDLEADQIKDISSVGGQIRQRYTFQMESAPGTEAMRDFFYAMYLAWQLDAPLYVDA